MLNNVERLQPEVRHDAPGCDRADALNESAAQVLLQPREGRWFCLLGMHNLELPTVLEVLAPVAGKAQCLTCVNVWKAAHYSEQIAFSRSFEPGDGVAGVFGVVGNALDDALQVFCGDRGCSIGRFAR